MPRDDITQSLDHVQRSNSGVGEHRAGGVAKPQATDHDVERVTVNRRQPEGRQRDLGDGEQARHEVLVAELDLVDLDPKRGLDPAPQGDLPHRRGPPGQLLEPQCHHTPPIHTLATSATPGR